MLNVYEQLEVGEEGYDAGARILVDFFKEQLQQFRTPELSELGQRIIDLAMDDASLQEYAEILPQ
jgi:hypothetical protein